MNNLFILNSPNLLVRKIWMIRSRDNLLQMFLDVGGNSFQMCNKNNLIDRDFKVIVENGNTTIHLLSIFTLAFQYDQDVKAAYASKKIIKLELKIWTSRSSK